MKTGEFFAIVNHPAFVVGTTSTGLDVGINTKAY
jgi:hypothetical protein